MSLVFSAFTMGLILSLLSLGMLISFRMIRFTDITVDGSITLGAAITAVLITQGWSPWLAALMAFLAGALAGSVTGVLHTRFKIQKILSGILMMTALYSINLRIMGRSNIPMLDANSFSDGMRDLLLKLFNNADRINVAGWQVSLIDAALLIMMTLITVVVGFLLYRFLLSHFGTALRAAGINDQMIRAQGVDHHGMIVFGLALGNGLVGLSGSLLSQYQGFADVQMGIGMMVWGLASIILGEALIGKNSLGLQIIAVVLGTILFRLLIAIALRWGLNPNDLKLVTALFVFMALVAPQWFRKLSGNFQRGKGHA